MKSNFKNIDLSSIGEGDAKLSDNVKPKNQDKKTRAKTLRAMPSLFFEAHERLLNKGDTSLDFSNYIVEAVREKLKKDGAL